jgi:HEAT repeat protein
MGLFEPVEPDVVRLKAARNLKGLVRALKYPKRAEVRSRAAEALGDLGDETATEALIVALADEDRFVRKMAATAFTKLRDPRAIEPLIDALADGDPFVREKAAEALGFLGDQRAIEPLEHLVKITECERFRATAEAALAEIERRQKLLRF